MPVSIRSPQSPAEWQAYYHFRWQQLRAPWQQPVGSEKDEFENEAWHIFVTSNTGSVHGCGRLHRIDTQTGQIRFMAVSSGHQAQGLGKKILQELESVAMTQGLTRIVLHAREQAAGFYIHLGYRTIEPSHTLYGTIPHTKMEKLLVDRTTNAVG